LNDLDFKGNQNELKFKKQLDEDLRKKKDELDDDTMKMLGETE
jgi:hypothetical protein